jgi:uncharacterized iron-regulated membrane protein
VFPAGSLDVHVRVVPAPVPGSPHLAVGPQPTLYTVGLWATPWPQLALLILLACAVFGVLRWPRRRRQRLAGALAAAVERGRREAEEQLAGVGADQNGAGHSAPDPE